MKRLLKWLGIGLLVLVGIIVVGGISLHFYGRLRLDKAPEVSTKPVAVPTDDTAIARGEHLVNVVSQCRDCHGDKLQGEVFFDDLMGIYLAAPNLTAGAGGVGATNSDADWERAIRHGVGADGRVLAIMPADYYQHYSDQDLGDLIAYLKSLPPVDNDLGPRRFGFPGSIMGGTVGFNDFTHVNGIDHANVGTFAPAEGATADYGQYMVSIAGCHFCHGDNLAGVVLAEGEDGPPEGPNLTPGGELSDWSESDFINTLRTGQTPSGEQLDSEMPWAIFSQMSDTELQAIWTYLHSLEALPNNSLNN